MQIEIIPPRAKLRTRQPTRAEARLIEDVLGYMQSTCAFWSNIYYEEMALEVCEEVPFAATDAHTIFLNLPAMLAHGWGIEEIAFVMAHEICHYFLGDLLLMLAWRELLAIIIDAQGTSLPYDHDLMNRAMDYRINAMLIDGKIGKFPKIGLYDPSLSEKGMEGCVEIYAKLWKQSEDAGQGFDLHLEPSQEEQDKDPAQEMMRKAIVIAAAVQAQEMSGQGPLPGAVKVLIGELMQPKVNWTEHLRSSMQRAAGEPGLDWSQVDRRLITRSPRVTFARKKAFGCGTVVIGIDTSGSVFNKTGAFLSEASGIVRDLNPERVVVIWCDAAIGRVDDLEDVDDLKDLHSRVSVEDVPGGGGSDMRPIFNYVAEHNIHPDMVVVLTDMLVEFPKSEPQYPVIWGSILPGMKAPFGHLVEIDID